MLVLIRSLELMYEISTPDRTTQNDLMVCEQSCRSPYIRSATSSYDGMMQQHVHHMQYVAGLESGRTKSSCFVQPRLGRFFCNISSAIRHRPKTARRSTIAVIQTPPCVAPDSVCALSRSLVQVRFAACAATSCKARLRAVADTVQYRGKTA